MTAQQMNHQYPRDLDLLAVEQPPKVVPTCVLAVIETPSTVEQEPLYGVFLPKRMRDEINRNNGEFYSPRAPWYELGRCSCLYQSDPTETDLIPKQYRISTGI